MKYLENHNVDPKLFIWSRSLKKVARAKPTTDMI